jgi:hypothetical protein
MARPVHQAEELGNPLHIEHVVTVDLPDGQACPPYYDGAIWRAIRRADGRTIWRRLYLKTKQTQPRVFRSLEEWQRDPWV